jgi:hypothetical protein
MYRGFDLPSSSHNLSVNTWILPFGQAVSYAMVDQGRWHVGEAEGELVD